MTSRHFPSGWYILPSIAISVVFWIALASFAFGSTGGAEFSFTFTDFLGLHAGNIFTICAVALAVVFGLIIASE